MHATLILLAGSLTIGVNAIADRFFLKFKDVHIPKFLGDDSGNATFHGEYNKPLGRPSSALLRDMRMTSDLALISYCEDLTDWSCRLCKKYPGVSAVQQIHEPVGKGFVAAFEEQRRVMVIFRPLKTVRNSFAVMKITKAAVDRKRRSIGRAHFGILRHWHQVREEYLDAVTKVMGSIGEERWNDERWELLISGVSYGGALSILSSWDLYQKFVVRKETPFDARVKIRVLTHGAPRVADKKFAATLEATPMHFQQVIIEDDLIAKVPGKGFDSVGEKIWQDPQGNWWLCQDKHDPRCDTTNHGSIPPHARYWTKPEYQVCELPAPMT